MKISYLGTTVLLFDDGTDQILFDAHITRPSLFTFLFGKLKSNEALAKRIYESYHMDRLRAIFISHTHHDHVLDMPAFANLSGADVYGSLSAVNVGLGGNVPSEKLHEYDLSSPVEIGSFKITVIPSLHSKPNMFNNDLGEMINTPFSPPAKKSFYKEGGSFDFFIRHENETFLIRPSYNYIEGQLDHIKADTLFLGVAGIAKSEPAFRDRFYEETLDKVQPSAVIPIHWDNFFQDLENPNYDMPRFIENTDEVHRLAKQACEERGIAYLLKRPLESFEI